MFIGFEFTVDQKPHNCIPSMLEEAILAPLLPHSHSLAAKSCTNLLLIIINLWYGHYSSTHTHTLVSLFRYEVLLLFALDDVVVLVFCCCWVLVGLSCMWLLASFCLWLFVGATFSLCKHTNSYFCYRWHLQLLIQITVCSHSFDVLMRCDIQIYPLGLHLVQTGVQLWWTARLLGWCDHVWIATLWTAWVCI